MPAGLQEPLFSFASGGGAGLPRPSSVPGSAGGLHASSGQRPSLRALGAVTPGLVLRVPCSPPAPPTPRPEAGDGAAPGEGACPQACVANTSRRRAEAVSPLPGAPCRGRSWCPVVCLSPPRVGRPHTQHSHLPEDQLLKAMSAHGSPVRGRCQPRPPAHRAFPHPGQRGSPARSFPKPLAPSAPSLPWDPLQRSEGRPALPRPLRAQHWVSMLRPRFRSHEPSHCLQEG